MSILPQFQLLEGKLYQKNLDIEKEWAKQEQEFAFPSIKFPKIKISDKLKAMIGVSAGVPLTLTFLEHVAALFNVDVSSLPWQMVVTSLMFGLSYKITKKYIKNEKSLPIHFLGNVAVVPSVFDGSSYALFYLKNNGNAGRRGEWIESVYPSAISKFLASPVYKNFLLIDALALSVYTTYSSLQFLDKKFKIVRRMKEKIIDLYSKVYERVNRVYQTSPLHKHLVRGALSVPLVASGNYWITLAPIVGIAMAEGMSQLKNLLR
ncbi:MAG: hypothetical protein QXS48_03585 [Candidatus Aenigmatarchaeota archaeon]